MKLNPYRHFYLYSKGWYKKSDRVLDLTKLISNYSGTPAECISKSDVYQFITYIIQDIVRKQKYTFYDILKHINPSNTWMVGYIHTKTPYTNLSKDLPVYDYETAVIYACLSALGLTDKSEFGELGEPDFTILPKKEI